jgi:hypothetical protein
MSQTNQVVLIGNFGDVVINPTRHATGAINPSASMANVTRHRATGPVVPIVAAGRSRHSVTHGSVASIVLSGRFRRVG